MRNHKFTKISSAISLFAMVGAPTLTMAQDDGVFKSRVNGYQEVPAVSTTGRGTFKAKIAEDESAITFDLSYSNLEGGNPTAAHIHLGRPGVNGGVIAFLCGGGCPPATGGTVTGTIDAADVIGPAGQGIAAEELNELIAALRARATYVNVHTPTYPGGEIRGAVIHKAED